MDRCGSRKRVVLDGNADTEVMISPMVAGGGGFDGSDNGENGDDKGKEAGGTIRYVH
jgi:hypothetical protein